MQDMLERLFAVQTEARNLKETIDTICPHIRAFDSHEEAQVLHNIWKAIIADMGDAAIAADNAFHLSGK